MAMRVPQYEQRQVASVQQPVGVTARQSGFGEVAKGIADVGQMFDQWQDDVDRGQATEADNAYSDLVRKTLYENETGYLYQQGGSALAQRKAAAETLQRAYDETLAGLSPAARDYAQNAMENRRQQALTAVDRHAGGERITYMNGQSDARVKSAIDDAVLDPAHIGRSLGISRREIADTGARMGWSPEEIAQKQSEAEGAIHGGIVTRLANVDPQGALDYLNSHRDSMSAGEVARLEGALIPEAKRRHGRQLGAAALQGNLPQQMMTARNFVGMNETDQRETLQKFLAEGGSNIDPAKTAWCAAFVNATLARAGNGGTGSNMARSFLDWGQAVNEPQVGDVVVLERGAPPYGHVGFFAGFAPDGSIQILGGNQGGAAQGGGGVTVSNFPASKVLGYRRADGSQASGPVGNGLAELVKIEDPDVRAAAIQEFNLMAGVAEQQQKAMQTAAQTAGFALIEQGGDIDSLTLDQKLAIGQDGMASLRTYQSKVNAGEPVVTDPELYVELSRQAATDPQAFAARNPLDWRNRLSDGDFKQMVDKQATAMKGGSSTEALTISTINTVTNDILTAAGIDGKKKDGAEKTARFQEGLLRWSSSFQQNNGRLPTHLELREQANAQLLPIVINPPGWNNEQEGSLFDLDFEGITPQDIMAGTLTVGGEAVDPEVVEEFVVAFEAAVGRAPTPQEVVEGLASAASDGTDVSRPLYDPGPALMSEAPGRVRGDLRSETSAAVPSALDGAPRSGPQVLVAGSDAEPFPRSLDYPGRGIAPRQQSSDTNDTLPGRAAIDAAPDRSSGAPRLGSAGREDDAPVSPDVNANLGSMAQRAGRILGRSSEAYQKISELVDLPEKASRLEAERAITRMIREVRALPRTSAAKSLLADLYEARDDL